MRRILWLYPRSWRERYGDEVSELLELVPLTPTRAADIALDAARVRLNTTGAALVTVSPWLALVLLSPAALIGIMILHIQWFDQPEQWAPLMGPLFAIVRPEHWIVTLPALSLAVAVMPLLRVKWSMRPTELAVIWRNHRLNVVVAMPSLLLLAYHAVEWIHHLFTWPGYGSGS